MKKIKLLALLATSVFFAQANSAYAEWKELGSNDVMTVYVDLDTVSTYFELTQIVSMLDFKKPGTNPENKKPVNSIIGLNEYNCPMISYRPLPTKNSLAIKAKGK